MDSEKQKGGEQQVREILINGLIRRGLAKPAGLTKAQFDDMCDDLCARLAYMSKINLGALEEDAASKPGGKDGDRFPIGNRILAWAALIQPPGDDASPLMRAVFANYLGRQAIAEGWAPELLRALRRSRHFPRSFEATQIRKEGLAAQRDHDQIEADLKQGRTVAPDRLAWREARTHALQKCRDLVELGDA